ncbi:MAG: type II toxin-antitoxin system VapC family toxin [Actinomycetota bacterium]|nr:type II toxin-antitoxin system VapC family toxin [Actinomycetota bacterium]
MIVLDASAIVDRLLGTAGRSEAVAEEMRRAWSHHTLDLAYVEVVSTLRRMAARGGLSTQRAKQALTDLAAAPVTRHPAAPLTERIWELRKSHSAYDAAYVALAEALDMPLLTTDQRLARSTGHSAQIVEAGASA